MKPDSERCLYLVAESQAGHFTRRQAVECDYTDQLLSYHLHAGRFVRPAHGVYRLRDYPSGPYDDMMAAWLAVGAESSVVSHESALDIADLSDVIPNWIHLTVPRGKRVKRRLPGARLHTSKWTMQQRDVVTREGMRVTSVARTIVDCAEAGTGPEQIEMAVEQAIHRAMTTPERLRESAQDRSRRVRDLIERSLELAAA